MRGPGGGDHRRQGALHDSTAAAVHVYVVRSTLLITLLQRDHATICVGDECSHFDVRRHFNVRKIDLL